ncbi:Anthocyanin 5-aromatic acyltransferase [Quillaja saponaria]|uniref:Anthocyanin 5-aromatic acyltransferase n=1 Tax=Quillaja saponaria TaxID=32244 RepID=A0AAD7LME7_QUISA|nr:Anthocyanin 5-aromatic acyltransferase [Quillaja saponaria]
MDGNSFFSFMKSWAYISSKLKGDSSSSILVPLPEYFTQIYDRILIRDPIGIEEMYLNEWLKQDGFGESNNNRNLMLEYLKVPADATRGSFELTPLDVEKLRQLVLTKLKDKKVNNSLSRFVLTGAYVWVSLAKVQEEEVIKHPRVVFWFNVDCRSHWKSPIPPRYFGNCIGFNRIAVDTKGLLGEGGLIIAVEALSEWVRSLGYESLSSKAKSWSFSSFDLQADNG